MQLTTLASVDVPICKRERMTANFAGFVRPGYEMVKRRALRGNVDLNTKTTNPYYFWLEM